MYNLTKLCIFLLNMFNIRKIFPLFKQKVKTCKYASTAYKYFSLEMKYLKEFLLVERK